MKLLITFITLTICCCDYLTERKDFLLEDSSLLIGNDLVLSENETKVDAYVTALKQVEHEKAMLSGRVLQRINFLYAQEEISNSDVFKFISRIPKGALNHIHDTALLNVLPLIKKWTYTDNFFACYNEKLQIYVYKFSEVKPYNNTDCFWFSVSAARIKFGNDNAFDQILLSNFTMKKKNVENLKDQNQIWKKFQNNFVSLVGFVTFKDVFVDYLLMGLQELLDDNIQFVEVRAMLPPLYDFHGVYNDPEDTLKVYIKTVEEFKARHSKSFFGVKFIYCILRSSTLDVVKDGVLKAIQLYKKYPEYVAGFDLVGQEDAGNSLLHYINELTIPSNIGETLPYIFHAGETDWQGSSIDENLFDAVLLNATRIGHGFAINKHPYLKNLAKKHDIAVEVCPISNQVLGLVADLRNHPAVVLLAEDYPVTISSDDPGMWGASGLSYDLYHVFMGMVPIDAGLKVLKKLFMNSIKYSSVRSEEREKLMNMWKQKWNMFIDTALIEYDL